MFVRRSTTGIGFWGHLFSFLLGGALLFVTIFYLHIKPHANHKHEKLKEQKAFKMKQLESKKEVLENQLQWAEWNGAKTQQINALVQANYSSALADSLESILFPLPTGLELHHPLDRDIFHALMSLYSDHTDLNKEEVLRSRDWFSLAMRNRLFLLELELNTYAASKRKALERLNSGLIEKSGN